MKKKNEHPIIGAIFFLIAIGIVFCFIWSHTGTSNSSTNIAPSTNNQTPQTQINQPNQAISNFISDATENNKPAANETIIGGESNEPPIPDTPIIEVDDTQQATPQQENIDLPSESYLTIDFVDVGQADFVFIDCDGKYMTIDGGNVNDSQLVYSYLSSKNVDHIDYVVVTHPHEDHCGGVSAILSKCTADKIFSPVTAYDSKAFSNVVKKAEEQSLSLTIPAVGDKYRLGSAEFEIIGPVKTNYSNINNSSIVIRLTYGNTSYMFAGDAEDVAEKDIMFGTSAEVRSDVLKVGHHGSSSSTSYIWLRQVDPTFAVISSNKTEAPQYGHPHKETLSKLRDAGVIVYRTDLQGTITCKSNGTDIFFSTERNQDIDTLSEVR